MNTYVLLGVLSMLLAIAFVFVARRASRGASDARLFDLGAVSTRWLSELRRDDPWTR